MRHIVTTGNFAKAFEVIKFMFISVFHTDGFDERGAFEDLA